MIWLGLILLGFAFVRLLVSLANCITRLSLPKVSKTVDEVLVSILIPARNEEENIGTLLSDIQKISYRNYEVIVYDDSSTDRTAEIVGEYCLKDSRVKLISGRDLEQGWLGKSYACHQLSFIACGEYYLYLDADVRVNGNLIEKSIYHIRKYNLGLLSIFPRQIMDSVGELISVPIMNRILLALLPLVLVRVSPWVSFSAANGQFMFFDASIYKKTQPHKECKSFKAEDIAICNYYKKKKIRVSTLLGDKEIQCRMYKSFKEAVNGFSKNVFAFFGNSLPVTLFYALYTTLAPFTLFYIFGLWAFLMYLAATIVMQLFISLASRQNGFLNIVLLPVQQFVFLWIVFSAISKSITKTLEWKGRNITEL